jgi:hypothetical protein
MPLASEHEYEATAEDPCSKVAPSAGVVIEIVGSVVSSVWAMAELGRAASPSNTDKTPIHGLIMNTL